MTTALLIACTSCAKNFVDGTTNAAGWSFMFLLAVIVPVLGTRGDRRCADRHLDRRFARILGHDDRSRDVGESSPDLRHHEVSGYELGLGVRRVDGPGPDGWHKPAIDGT